MTINWGGPLIVKLDGWRTNDKKYFRKYYDSGGYRYTKGVFIKPDSVGETYEACRRLLTEIADCEWNSDCTNYCHNEEGVENGYCSDKKCYCVDTLTPYVGRCIPDDTL